MSRTSSRHHRRSSGSAQAKPERRRNPWETVTLVHVGVTILLASWAFGGGADWARGLISAWGSLGVVITVGLTWQNRGRSGDALVPLRWLWPAVVYSGLVLLSTWNPSFQEKIYEGQSLLAYTGPIHPNLPSTARAADSLEHLWLFDAVYLTCFNLTLAVRRRRALRILLVVAAANAVLLSVFGTFQRLTSDGLFFGHVAAPNARFFATFIYGNHWAAYIVLVIAAGLGLAFYQARRQAGESLVGSPLGLGVFALLLMAVTPTLAGSRAGTAMVIVLLAVGLGHALLQILRQRRQNGESAALPVAGLALILVVAVGGALYLGQDSLQERWRDTQGQLQKGILAERIALYRDTWRLTQDHPCFGWGLGSYDKTLQLLRPRPLEANRQYEHSYVDAHSDWLQSLAEVGFVGTLCIGLAGLLPLLTIGFGSLRSLIPGYLIAGCALVLLYAGVEFPFGNPAVVVMWWFCFFSAIQYVRLQRRDHDAPASGPASPA